MDYTRQRANQHLLWRAGFGPAATDRIQLQKLGRREIVDLLFKSSSRSPALIQVTDNPVDGIMKGLREAGKLQQGLSDEERKKMREMSREGIRNLNLRWIDEMVETPAQLREKVALFWHGHFACRNLNMYFQQQLLQVIREHALGNFGDLLRAVSRTPAMLAFLNNQQNRKQKPNENFAREVMELFTLGRGFYTEKDIKEAARAFTGWGFTGQGEFIFRRAFHDEGSKTVLGRTGNFDGDDILNILLAQQQTARFITTKLYRFFVNEVVNEKQVTLWAEEFYKSGYDITRLLKSMFSSDHFYEERNMGTRIKSPIELWVGMRRALPMQLQNPETQLLVQRVLGQVLFYPPNVAGWPGGKTWIDSSTLLFRMRLPRVIIDQDTVNISPKADDDVQMGMMERRAADQEMANRRAGLGRNGGQLIRADIRWEKVLDIYRQVGKEELQDELLRSLLQVPLKDPKLLTAHARRESREAYITSQVLNIMSLPEYQLC